jgi:RNA polymerase sigma-70 factor (ECF subfamily)
VFEQTVMVDDPPRLLADDLDAGFAALVRAHERDLWSVALRVSGSPADAEDLCAETFTRAYRALAGYGPARRAELAVRPWLMTILLNTWRNTVRSRSRRPRSVPLGDGPEPVAAERPAAEWAEHDEDARRLAALVRLLPEAPRTAVVLRHVAGLSIAEIAEVLGCPEGTAKSHVSRGLARLRELYATDQAEEAP